MRRLLTNTILLIIKLRRTIHLHQYLLQLGVVGLVLI